MPLHIIDTAGLRQSDDEVEKIGIERSWAAIASADAVLFLHDLTRWDDSVYQAADQEIGNTLARQLAKHIPLLDIWNKADATSLRPLQGIGLSAKTGTGLDDLRQALLQAAGWQNQGGEGVFMARERHLQAIQRVQYHLHEAHLHLTGCDPALDLLAEELRLAQNSLNEITGEFSSDDLLGVIFTQFCIGK